VTPTSSAQARALEDGTVPPLERVRDRIWAVPLAMPGGQPRLNYTLTYVLVDDEERLHVVDPAWNSDENWDTFWRAVRTIPSRGEIASIIVTHLHPDHIAMAPRLRDATGASIVLHEQEAAALERLDVIRSIDFEKWGVPDDRMEELRSLDGARDAYTTVRPDIELTGDIDRLHPPGLDIEVLHTPGHTTGSICLRLPDERLLLTGDHVLPAIYPGLGLGGPSARNPIADYLDSLGRVVGYDDHEVLPGHNYRFTGLAERVARTAAHHRRRTDEVERTLRAQPHASVFEVASTLTWTAGWDRMRGFFLYSALAQTAMHIDFLRTTEHDHSARSIA
jgi:glyoxylase-like metal-dependent hydrolase (beta-lactamase superfamily II)